MKGIVLAGGSGTRLHPITKVVSKQLLPVYDKPMIYYPISVLMLAGIRDILIISTPQDKGAFEALLGDGSDFGINLSFAVQEKPEGLAQAFIIGADFIGSDSVTLILGDNIFWGQGLTSILKDAVANVNGATIFGYAVRDPERFGVVEFDKNNLVLSVEEKPQIPKSNVAITGLYIYDNNVVAYAKRLMPSKRGELEITSLNQIYLDAKKLDILMLGRGFAWLDAGTHESLLEASLFMETIEKRQGFKVACLEEIAWRNGWISDDRLSSLADDLLKSGYGVYLKGVMKHGIN